MRRVLLGFGLFIAATTIAGVWNFDRISARYAAHQFRSAVDEDSQKLRAARLVQLGDVGTPYLLQTLRSDDPAAATIVIDALVESMSGDSIDEVARLRICRPYFDQFDTFSESGRAAALAMISSIVETQDPETMSACRAMVRSGLKLSDASAKLRAIRLSLHPKIALAAEATPLLRDQADEVRRAALLAVGPVTESGAIVADEELFPCLHDSDIRVRMLCESALTSRGLSSDQIELARHLSSPDPAERLDTLIVLRRSEAVRDPGPWLDRLSRDVDPAVRIGAARAAYEHGLHYTTWLDRLAREDGDQNVRRWAEYYRGLNSQVKAAEFTEER